MENRFRDLLSFRHYERNFEGFYVFCERQKWRERIRQLNIEVADALSPIGSVCKDAQLQVLLKVRAELAVRLNPSDKNDQRILVTLDEVIDNPVANNYKSNRFKQFQMELAWLLKEDWERVKHDARPIWKIFRMPPQVIRELPVEPNFMTSEISHQRVSSARRRMMISRLVKHSFIRLVSLLFLVIMFFVMSVFVFSILVFFFSFSLELSDKLSGKLSEIILGF